MRRWVLRIRRADRAIFDAMVSGRKTVETRAATPRYQSVRPGDGFVVLCDGDRLDLTVTSAAHFDSVAAMLEATNYSDIFPDAVSADAAAASYVAFGEYPDGIMAYLIKRTKSERK